MFLLSNMIKYVSFRVVPLIMVTMVHWEPLWPSRGTTMDGSPSWQSGVVSVVHCFQIDDANMTIKPATIR